MNVNGRQIGRKGIYVRTGVHKRIVLKSVKMVRYLKSKNAAGNVRFKIPNFWISVSVRVNLTEGKVAFAIDLMDKRTLRKMSSKI